MRQPHHEANAIVLIERIKRILLMIPQGSPWDTGECLPEKKCLCLLLR